MKLWIDLPWDLFLKSMLWMWVRFFEGKIDTEQGLIIVSCFFSKLKIRESNFKIQNYIALNDRS